MQLEALVIADRFEDRCLKWSARSRGVRGLVKNWLEPSLRLLQFRRCPPVVLYKVGERILGGVMQRTPGPRLQELTIGMSTVDVDQSAVGTAYANVYAPSLFVIYCDERPVLSLLECEGKAVALAGSKS